MIRARYVSKRIIDVLSVDLDTASFEKGHYLFPYNIPFFFNRIKRRIIFEFKRYGFAKSKK